MNKLFADRVREDRVTGGQVNKLFADRVRGDRVTGGQGDRVTCLTDFWGMR